MEGTVKFFNRMKNFGFISGEDGKDYFVHRSKIEGEKNVYENDKVTFDVGEADKGPVAENVKVVSSQE